MEGANKALFVMAAVAGLAALALGLPQLAGVRDISPRPVQAATAAISPSKDNTLYDYVVADGDRSNGIGTRFFAGRTDQGRLRRGVLAFDVAGSIPAGSTITSVTLSMNMSRTNLNTARTIELHRLLAGGGEGTPNAAQKGGGGVPATTNDATWRHRFYSSVFWSTQGGDFTATASDTESVGATGPYTWTSGQMAAD